MNIRNGYSFVTQASNVFTVIYLTGNKFGLLNLGSHTEGPHLTAPMFKHVKSGQWMFTKIELQKLLKEYKAKRVDLKLDQVSVVKEKI